MTDEFNLRAEGCQLGDTLGAEALSSINASKISGMDVRNFGSLIADRLREAEEGLRAQGCGESEIKVFSNAVGSRVCEMFNEFRAGLNVAANASKGN